jgi:TetR/AcrR family transcriptional regulator, transcriptional repressor for nem operon
MDMQTTFVRRRGRPPKNPEGRLETRELLLRAGVAALTEKGFVATGLDDILGRVGVPKGSFYHYFDSKEAFGTALIDRYGAYFSRKLAQHFENTDRSPLARLQAFIDDAKAGMAKYGYQRGCLIGNLGQEMGALPESYRAQLGGVFADWQGQVAGCLSAAQGAGELAANADCVRLAGYFWIAWEGAVLRAKLERSPLALDIFAEVFFAGLPRR